MVRTVLWGTEKPRSLIGAADIGSSAKIAELDPFKMLSLKILES